MITVIGSGFGAFGVVKKLVDASINVRVITSVKDTKIRNLGVSFNMPRVQSPGLGGTSNIWGGGFAPLEKVDFTHWPLEYEELEPYYTQIADYFGFDFNKYQTQHQENDIKGQIDHVEYDKSIFLNKWFLIPLPIIRLREYYKRWEAEGKLEIVYDEIEKIDFDSHIAFSKTTGYKYSKVILCCGCLNTSRILANSGYSNPNLGRFLSDHPKLYFASIKLNKPMPKNSVYAFMKYGDQLGIQVKTGLILQKPEEYGNHNIYCKPLFRDIRTTKKIETLGTFIWTLGKDVFKPWNIFKLIFNLKTLVQGAAYKFNLYQKYRNVGLFAILENRPFIDSTVSLERRGEIDYRICDEEIRSYLEYFKEVSSTFGQNCTLLIDSKESFLQNVSSAAHFTGTTRMALKDSERVVDNNLGLLDISDAYVCDGGVFPSNGNANISMTILALSLRLGDHIIKDNR